MCTGLFQGTFGHPQRKRSAAQAHLGFSRFLHNLSFHSLDFGNHVHFQFCFVRCNFLVDQPLEIDHTQKTGVSAMLRGPNTAMQTRLFSSKPLHTGEDRRHCSHNLALGMCDVPSVAGYKGARSSHSSSRGPTQRVMRRAKKQNMKKFRQAFRNLGGGPSGTSVLSPHAVKAWYIFCPQGVKNPQAPPPPPAPNPLAIFGQCLPGLWGSVAQPAPFSRFRPPHAA